MNVIIMSGPKITPYHGAAEPSHQPCIMGALHHLNLKNYCIHV
jgi:hypothetical protein